MYQPDKYKMDEIGLERRKYIRSRPDSLIKASISPVGEENEFWGVVNNMSSHGLGISIIVGIEPETLLDITLARKPKNNMWELSHFTGKVRWCLADPKTKGSYVIGINELQATE